jgi:tetratricopeptide (TPR) repeat protein
MDCPGCGREIAEEDAFCRHCGARLGGPPKQSRSATVDDMEREYRQWLADKPQDADAHYNVGLANLYSGNYDEAEKSFRTVVELLPEEASGYEKLAVALAKLGRRREALEEAQAACRLDPECEAIRRLVKALGG